MSMKKFKVSVTTGLLTILCLAAFQARTVRAQSAQRAQEVQNGMETRTPRQMTERMSTASIMGSVPVGGPWIEFAFTGTGSMATGCSPADSGGPGCSPSSGGNSAFGGKPPWTFTAPAGGAMITVTDAFLRGDQFDVLDNNVAIGPTSAPVTTGSCGDNPDPCLVDPQVSHGVFNVAAGPHSITIRAKASPFGAGAAYFRIDLAPPALDHWMCYDVKPINSFKPRKVAIRNQFEVNEYLVLSPRLLCVPSSKKLLQ
ncbi:MAG: hypothetical protein QOE46_1301 [Acidobacteriota bacterium]|nr:hypothetical protein [Acidobacteriota bacterium]